MARQRMEERHKVYKGKKRVDGHNTPVLPKYVDMSKWKDKAYEPAEWECMKCHSNSLLPMEYGCNMCQPFNEGAKLTGRKYKREEVLA